MSIPQPSIGIHRLAKGTWPSLDEIAAVAAISFALAVLMLPLEAGISVPASVVGAIAGSRRARRLLQEQVIVRSWVFVGIGSAGGVAAYLGLAYLFGATPTPEGAVLSAALGAVAVGVGFKLSEAGISGLLGEAIVASLTEFLRVSAEKVTFWWRGRNAPSESNGSEPAMENERRETRNEET